MANYRRELTPLLGVPMDYPTPTTACFAQPQGVDIKTLHDPQKDFNTGAVYIEGQNTEGILRQLENPKKVFAAMAW